MNNEIVLNLFKMTLDPNQKDAAEKQLQEMSEHPGFPQIVFQIILSDGLDMAIRQAASIYFKNFVTKKWNILVNHSKTDKIVPINDADKSVIKDNIVEAIIHIPELLRSQLSVAFYTIIKHEYPTHYPKLVPKLENILKGNNHAILIGGLECLHQIVKNYEYKKSNSRAPLNDCFAKLSPILVEKFNFLIPDSGESSVNIQKHIFKTFYCATQFQMPPFLINPASISTWMQIFLASLNVPIPQSVNSLEDDDEKAGCIWWKCKKWIMHILCRFCERYGSPAIASKDYKEFAQYFMTTFSSPIIETILKYLDFYRQNNYVSPRVLQFCFEYLTESMVQSYNWVLIKPHISVLIKEIVFKLLKPTDEDEELWENEPIEYIRNKFDIYEEFGSPITGAKDFLHTVCLKRKGILQETVQHCVATLQQLYTLTAASFTAQQSFTSDASMENNFREIDGWLTMLGYLGETLILNLYTNAVKQHNPHKVMNGVNQKAELNEEMDDEIISPDIVDWSPISFMMTNLVFPLLTHPKGFLRARACWMIYQYRKIKWEKPDDLQNMLIVLQKLLLNDPDLPVKVECANALKSLAMRSDNAKNALLPNLKEILSELLNIIRQVQSEDMTMIMKKFICIYTEEIKPLIVEMLQHSFTILQGAEISKDDDESRMFVSGMLELVETLVDILEENKEAICAISGKVVEIIKLVMVKYHADPESEEDYYDEVISLAFALTCHTIPGPAWELLPFYLTIFTKDKLSYFTELFSILHNYVTLDTPAFLSDPNRLLLFFNMCKGVMQDSDKDEDIEMHALKFLEILLYECSNQKDQLIPLSLELVMPPLLKYIVSKFQNKNETKIENQPIKDAREIITNGIKENGVKNGMDEEDERYHMTETNAQMHTLVVLACLFLNPSLTLKAFLSISPEQCTDGTPEQITFLRNYMAGKVNNTNANNKNGDGNTNKIKTIEPSTAALELFIIHWFGQIKTGFYNGIHDNKVCVLALSSMLNMPTDIQPLLTPFMIKYGQKMMRGCLTQLEELNKLKQSRKKSEQSESSWEDQDGEADEDIEDYDPDSDDDITPQDLKEPLNDDEDDVDTNRKRYLEAVAPSAANDDNSAGDHGMNEEYGKAQNLDEPIENDSEVEDEYEDDEDFDMTGLDSFTCLVDDDTKINEFVLFKQSIQELQKRDPNLSMQMFGQLNESQLKRLNQIFTLADRPIS